MNIKAPPNSSKKPVTTEHAETKRNGRFTRSLKFKSYLFIALLLSYIAFIALFEISQRHKPLQQLQQYQDIQETQKALVQTDIAAFHIVTTLFSDISTTNSQKLAQYFSHLQQQYSNLQKWFPEQAEAFKNLLVTLPDKNAKTNRQNLQKIYIHLEQSKTELNKFRALNYARLANLVEAHRSHTDSTVVITLALGIMGLILLGAISSLFFNRLKNDINALQKRTTEIIHGYRETPLPVTREDEVGQLTRGVNDMANALAEREQALEIQYSKAAFMEKMCAIDSLAGGIAHEIGNPVSCIAGLAEEIKNDEKNQLTKSSQDNLNSLLKYIESPLKITRDLSVIDTHKRNEFELLDINQLISNTYNIFHYDKRWTNININLDLDYTAPAIFASVNQITQLISNTLANSMDAVQNKPMAEINIQSSVHDGQHISIRVQDNGTGIDKDTLQHIFDPFFSTKPVGQGAGLGLTICWSIAKAHNGSINATSIAGEKTEIYIILPIKQTGNPA